MRRERCSANSDAPRAVHGGPRLALPIHHAGEAAIAVHALPPGLASGVSATLVKIVFLRIARHHVRIGFFVRARRHAEKSGLGIDGAQVAVRPDLHPCDVVAHGPHAIALLFERGNHHGQIRLAAGARESRRHVRDFPGGIFEAQDQHVLGHPALLARHPARDAQRETLLAEQRVAAVARADAPDQFFFGEMQDEAAVGVQIAQRMQSRERNRPSCRGGPAPPCPCAT